MVDESTKSDAPLVTDAMSTSHATQEREAETDMKAETGRMLRMIKMKVNVYGSQVSVCLRLKREDLVPKPLVELSTTLPRSRGAVLHSRFLCCT